MMEIPKGVLVWDIETDGINVRTCNLKSFHAYSYASNKYYNYFYWEHDKIIELMHNHRFHVTYNGDEFDIPIINRFSKVPLFINLSLDLIRVIRKRETLIRYGGFQSKSLANVCKDLNLEQKKMEGFDYGILQKDKWTEEEKETIIRYGRQDINATKALFEYLYSYFYFYKDYLKEEDNARWSWLMTSSGTYAYKAICNLSGIKEEWLKDSNKIEYQSFKGGYVSTPTVEQISGNIYCLDFNSAYPHAYMMLNLFGFKCNCCTEEEKFNKNELFTLKGRYCTKKLNKVSETIKMLYNLRMDYKKKGDQRQMAVKIILNTLYGICGSPIFKNMYNLNSVSDCTLFARETLKYARDKFISAGYQYLYSDTDSIYLRDPYSDKQRMLLIKNSIIKKINDSVPFPQPTYDLGIDEEIKHIYFPNKNKKSYLYVNTDNQVTTKGLPLFKRDASKVSRQIFNKYLKDNIIKGIFKYTFKELYEWVMKELEKDLSLAARTFTVLNISIYKSTTSIQYRIIKEYGPGKHLLIPNRFHGVGKSIKYCTIDEFKQRGVSIHGIILNKTWKELKPFMSTKAPLIQKALKEQNQRELLRWTNIQ